MIATVINTFGPGAVVERFNISFKDLTAGALTQAFNLKPLPKGSLILGIRLRLREAFAGGTIATATLSIGTTGTTAVAILAAKNIFTGVAADTCYTSSTTGLLQGTYAADTLTATVTTTVGNVNAATAGSVDVDVVYIPFSDLTGTQGGGLL